MANDPVQHRQRLRRFEISNEAGTAFLEYQLVADRMTIHHTYVPSELRGRGIATQLVETALQFARNENLQVIPQCSYVAAYIDRQRSH